MEIGQLDALSSGADGGRERPRADKWRGARRELVRSIIQRQGRDERGDADEWGRDGVSETDFAGVEYWIGEYEYMDASAWERMREDELELGHGAVMSTRAWWTEECFGVCDCGCGCWQR